MTSLLLAICRLLWRWRGYEIVVIPDRIPPSVEAAVWAEDGWL